MDARLDDKGRMAVEAMTDRQLLEECVTTMRNTNDMVMQFLGSMETHPMMKAMTMMSGGKRT